MGSMFLRHTHFRLVICSRPSSRGISVVFSVASQSSYLSLWVTIDSQSWAFGKGLSSFLFGAKEDEVDDDWPTGCYEIVAGPFEGASDMPNTLKSIDFQW